MYKADEIAKYFIAMSEPNTSKSVDPLKLQKLLYYSQGFHLLVTDQPLFRDRIEAWVHGPVVPKVYRKYKHFEGSEITPLNLETKLELLDRKTKKVLNFVWENFSQYSGKELENMTHKEMPWKSAREGLLPFEPSTNEVRIDNIKSYFIERYKKKSD